jgi:histone H3/H4
VSAKSAESAVSEAAKEYLAEVLESIFDKLIENQ